MKKCINITATLSLGTYTTSPDVGKHPHLSPSQSYNFFFLDLSVWPTQKLSKLLIFPRWYKLAQGSYMHEHYLYLKDWVFWNMLRKILLWMDLYWPSAQTWRSTNILGNYKWMKSQFLQQENDYTKFTAFHTLLFLSVPQTSCFLRPWECDIACTTFTVHAKHRLN